MYPKNLHDADTRAAVRARIEALDAGAQPAWGRMNVAQMLAHCAEVMEVMNGKELKGTPLFIRVLGPLVKGVVLSTKPYSKNSPTHPQYVKAGTEDFERSRARLLAALDSTSPRAFRHPIFGQLTAEQAGWASWKHLNHHLEQFGA
jgi:hypothetical protein